MPTKEPKQPLQFGIRHLLAFITTVGVLLAVATSVPWNGTFRPWNQAVFPLIGGVWASNAVLLGKLVRQGAIAGALIANLFVVDWIVFGVLDRAPRQAVWLSFYVGFTGGCLGGSAAA